LGEEEAEFFIQMMRMLLNKNAYGHLSMDIVRLGCAGGNGNEHLNQQQEIPAVQILGYVYPAYLCFKDVDRGKPDRLKLWCMYWCVGYEYIGSCKLVCAFTTKSL